MFLEKSASLSCLHKLHYLLVSLAVAEVGSIPLLLPPHMCCLFISVGTHCMECGEKQLSEITGGIINGN